LFWNFFARLGLRREKENISTQTLSILASPKKAALFKNPEYYLYEGPIDPNCATSHLHVWTGYYERFKVSMKQYHEHHQQSLERNKSRTLLRHENEKLKEIIDQYSHNFATLEQLLKEKISKEVLLQEMLKEEIDKTKDSNDAYDLEFIMMPEGKVQLRLKRKSGIYPPQVTKCVSNLQERMLEDYDPQNQDVFNHKRRRSSTEQFVESFLSQAVALPEEDEDQNYIVHTNQPRSGFLGRCAQQAQAFLPTYGAYVTVSLGKVVDWLKSAR